MHRLALISLLVPVLAACPSDKNDSTGSATDDSSTSAAASSSSTTGEPTTDAPTTGEPTTGEPTGTDSTSSGGSTGIGGSTDDPSGTTVGDTTHTTDQTTGANPDECEFLVGKIFTSDEQFECGLGPNGPEMCHWTIAFTDTTYDHQYSDVGEQGTYTCEDGAIVGTDGLNNQHTGTIDADTGKLVWDDIAYTVFI